MKALKYGMALVLGLSLSVCGAQVFAQASGQTQEVTPNNPNTLPEVPAASQTGQVAQQAEEQPQRGVPTPKAIEKMVDNGEYDAAVKEFEKFMKTAKGNPCDLIYLPYTFYDRLRMEDTSKTAFYQQKADMYINKYLQTCGNTVDGYLLKESVGERIPDSTVARMTKAIAIEPNYAMLYTMRGDALWQLERTQEACADYAKAKELGDEYATMMVNTNCPQETAVDGNAE